MNLHYKKINSLISSNKFIMHSLYIVCFLSNLFIAIENSDIGSTYMTIIVGVTYILYGIIRGVLKLEKSLFLYIAIVFNILAPIILFAFIL